MAWPACYLRPDLGLRMGTRAWRAGVTPRTLPATLLAAAPAFLEPLHEAEPGLLPRPPAAPGGRTVAALATLATGGGGLCAGHAKALAAHDPAHVPPAGQRPHRTRQHDEEPADADKDDLRNHSGQEQAYTDHEPDRGLDDPALVVDPGILRAHGLGKLRVVGIERLLDLLELTLLVLRERHCASHEPLAWGRVR